MQMPWELREGYQRFRREQYVRQHERYKELAQGQAPATMIVACADSRVDPATIFSAAPGELFVVRNVAALVPPYEETGTFHGTSAALEFAVEGLQVSNIVVMGHAMCGGVAAALAIAEKRPVGRFIAPWVNLLAEAREQVISQTDSSHPALRQQAMERMAVLTSLGNMLTFPFLAKAVDEGRLSIHGAWFSIASGELHWLDDEARVFERVEG